MHTEKGKNAAPQSNRAAAKKILLFNNIQISPKRQRLIRKVSFFILFSYGVSRLISGLCSRTRRRISSRLHGQRFSPPPAPTAEEEEAPSHHFQRGAARATGGHVRTDTLPGRRPQGATRPQSGPQGGASGGELKNQSFNFSFCIVLVKNYP